MAQVVATMDDVQILMDRDPAFKQALTLVAMERRVDELEADQSACNCKKNEGD